MSEIQWQASRFEQRTAWLVAIVAIGIIAVAASQPQWFAFSLAPETTQLAHKQQGRELPRKLISKPPHKAVVSPKKTAMQVQTKHTKGIAATTPTKPQASIKRKLDHKPATSRRATHSTAAHTTSMMAKGFYVQLGAFKDRQRAQRLNNKLKKKGWSVHMIDRKAGLHAIWVGPKSSHSKAEKLLKNIQRKLHYTGFIVQNNT